MYSDLSGVEVGVGKVTPIDCLVFFFKPVMIPLQNLIRLNMSCNSQQLGRMIYILSECMSNHCSPTFWFQLKCAQQGGNRASLKVFQALFKATSQGSTDLQQPGFFGEASHFNKYLERAFHQFSEVFIDFILN